MIESEWQVTRELKVIPSLYSFPFCALLYSSIYEYIIYTFFIFIPIFSLSLVSLNMSKNLKYINV